MKKLIVMLLLAAFVGVATLGSIGCSGGETKTTTKSTTGTPDTKK